MPIFALVLNPMRGRTEGQHIAAFTVCKNTDDERAASRKKLEAYYTEQLSEMPYEDGPWYRVFKNGGPLMWMNGLRRKDGQTIFDPHENYGTHGIFEFQHIADMAPAEAENFWINRILGVHPQGTPDSRRL